MEEIFVRPARARKISKVDLLGAMTHDKIYLLLCCLSKSLDMVMANPTHDSD